MKIRWMILFFPVVSVVVVSLLVKEHAAIAAVPQGAAAAVSAASVASMAANSSGALAIPDTTLAINSAQPMSQRVVHYEIEAKYDAAKHTVDATEVLTYHNLTGQALDHFPFHLYQNAFQPNATWIRETKVAGGRDVSYEKWDDKDYGSEEIKSLEVVGLGDLTSAVQYIQPDDGNKDDKTVVDVHLPRRLLPVRSCSSRSRSGPSFPKPRRARDGSTISCWAGSGSPRLASSGTEHGTAISIMPSLSSLPTSVCTTSN
jgi:hypothetical protein